MRVSFEWLCELAGVNDEGPAEVARRLTMAGWNVEGIIEVDLHEILVGRVISQVAHPSSNKPLWIHQVDLGGENRQIIAGASNAIPGSVVPVALPGVTVPSGVTVRDGRIAGFEARGMLCSAAELLLSDDHAGILLLDAGRPGQRLDEVLPAGAVLEVDVTPNRPDCLSHLGLARELAAASGRGLGRDFMPMFTGGIEPPATELIEVAVEEPELCPRYIGAVITGITVGPSPGWMQRRLRAAGLRPINNVVDVTNYVALEYGQPLHAFDLAKLKGPRIRVRRAAAGERLACLDGEARELGPSMLVIADADQPVALAGLIGGAASAVTGSTTAILLEAANFAGPSIRATSRLLRLRTEASARFEKGISPELALAGARRAAGLISELTGGLVHLGWPDLYPAPQPPVRVVFRPERVDALLGAHVPLEEMEAILRRLDFQVRVHDSAEGVWDALPPVFRLDVAIPEDVIEEVGRIHGYDKVPPTLPGGRRQEWRPSEPSLESRLDPLRQALAGAGHTEVITPALVAGGILDRAGAAGRRMRVLNAVSEQDTMRTSLVPSLLEVAATNRNRGRARVAIFEVARAYLGQEDPEAPPSEPLRVAALRSAAGGSEAGRRAVLELKGALERAAATLTGAPVEYERAEAPMFHPGRCARIRIAGQTLGFVGELHPRSVAAMDLDGRISAFEVDLEPLVAAAGSRRARPLPRFPGVERDLAVVVAESTEAGALLGTLRGSAGPLLEAARAFDEYRGSQVPAGRKSVAFGLAFRAPDRTLTDAEVDRAMTGVRSALEAEHGASFRG